VVSCALCNRDLKDPSAASISGGIMGDEYIESWYFCASCGVYIVSERRNAVATLTEGAYAAEVNVKSSREPACTRQPRDRDAPALGK